MKKFILIVVIMTCWSRSIYSQRMQLGADLSTIEQLINDNCAEFGYKNGENFWPVNPYKIFKWEGADIVRLRVWVNPIGGLSSVDEVVEACKKIKENGNMKVMINFHYSDTWADPKGQWIPEAWRKDQNYSDWKWLGNKIYNHTLNTLNKIMDTGVTIAYVQIGNETDTAMCDTRLAENVSWDSIKRLSALLKFGVKGVNDSEASSAKIIVHYSRADLMETWFDKLTEFSDSWTLKKEEVDVIGVSYYPTFHQIEKNISFAQLETYIRDTRRNSGREVMIVETAYPFTSEYKDNLRNNINATLIEDNGLPVTEKGQYEWYDSLSETAANAGALGVISWEPGWVAAKNGSKSCTKVPRGTEDGREKRFLDSGSSMEHCTFFDFDGNVMRNGGFRWLNANKNSGYKRNLWLGKSEVANDLEQYPSLSSLIISTNQKILSIQYEKPISSVDVYGINGKRYFHKYIYDQKGEILSIPLSNLSNGLYIIKVGIGNSSYTKKIML
ncbi:glycosyl hydrolase 53 family protein [Aquimarina latercula]|uniref:glycosyl hydrolase 53 family protein n=1 Tax=Aquimarina latercula TaxID=987 RepID=UPI00138AB12B|nr:glycosyl hydrolase 53 family protein [Aquimarina latercula]